MSKTWFNRKILLILGFVSVMACSRDESQPVAFYLPIIENGEISFTEKPLSVTPNLKTLNSSIAQFEVGERFKEDSEGKLYSMPGVLPNFEFTEISPNVFMPKNSSINTQAAIMYQAIDNIFSMLRDSGVVLSSLWPMKVSLDLSVSSQVQNSRLPIDNNAFYFSVTDGIYFLPFTNDDDVPYGINSNVFYHEFGHRFIRHLHADKNGSFSSLRSFEEFTEIEPGVIVNYKSKDGQIYFHNSFVSGAISEGFSDLFVYVFNGGKDLFGFKKEYLEKKYKGDFSTDKKLNSRNISPAKIEETFSSEEYWERISADRVRDLEKAHYDKEVSKRVGRAEEILGVGKYSVGTWYARTLFSFMEYKFGNQNTYEQRSNMLKYISSLIQNELRDEMLKATDSLLQTRIVFKALKNKDEELLTKFCTSKDFNQKLSPMCEVL